jgi:hypothetical protein
VRPAVRIGWAGCLENRINRGRCAVRAGAEEPIAPEPVYTVNGKKTDAPFHDEMLASREGEAAADELAIRTAMKVLGWSREKAEAFILGGKPDVK